MKAVRGAAVLAALAGLGCCAQAGWIHLKAQLAQVLIGRAWERREHGERDARPWPWADTQPIAKLTLPGAPPRELFVLEGASGRNLAFGPAHDPASVAPGERGNSVIAGHRDTAFRALQSLHVGDRLQVERAGRRLWFEVRDVRIVDSRRTRLALSHGRPRVTLVTCYPFASLDYGGPLRWVVTADLLDAPPRQP
ncbi:MAG TPA: class GN sortase [Steroidobacteraceae bacterium]|nr:class GN sortase [Steroidobacteraceae bacterium]